MFYNAKFKIRNPFLKTMDDSLLTVKVFQKDVHVKFSSLKVSTRYISEAEKQARVTKRSKIVKFSKRSAKRLRHVIRNSEDIWKVFITLTYPENFPCDGKTTKIHLNAFLQYLRRKGIKYAWVLEFQTRGAPHYHIIASDSIPKYELSERWYKIVDSGDEKHLRAGTGIDYIKSKNHLYGYLSSYINKIDQKLVPEGFENVGRFWGATTNILTYELRQEIGHYYRLVWFIKLLRNWYKAHLRKFGIKWKWRGQGFIALDGMLLVKQLRELRC